VKSVVAYLPPFFAISADRPFLREGGGRGDGVYEVGDP
jgi:hypothetical protein